MNSLLSSINSPQDIKQLDSVQLKKLTAEIRQFIIDTLASHPGHLASSLGTVELTLALHYVFNTPDDKLIWDVGHQAYAHKIITGRRDAFASIRTYGGISGFPRMDESPYDAFGTGHSSTSISAALGMAEASKLKGELHRHHIAVIGDGSMTGGEAFEALNNAGISKANILVVLNDNGISIDKAVGGLSRNLTRITSSRHYNALKERLWNALDGNKKHHRVGIYQYLTFLAKTALLGQPNMFEGLGFRYFGPIDGHNLDELVSTLEKIRDLKGPRLLHIVTKKGKGLHTAEQDPVIYHAPGTFNASTGKRISSIVTECPPRYQDVFGNTIVELAQKNPKIVGITPAMLTGSSLSIMKEAMPDRTFDVGIAEQHAVTFAAGLATQGMLPFCNIYSSFMQRAFDQVIHDVALQHLNVVMCLDRAGIVGDDGATHHGVFDLAYMRMIPGLTICAPMDDHELRLMMFTAQQDNQGPVVIRYPRGRAVNVDWRNEMHALQVGKGRQLKEGTQVALLSVGHIGNAAFAAANEAQQQGVSVAMYDMRYVKPLDHELLNQVIEGPYQRVITVEDGVVAGGFGSAVLEYFAQCGCTKEVQVFGIPDHFVTHGNVAQLHHDCGIDKESILKALLATPKH